MLQAKIWTMTVKKINIELKALIIGNDTYTFIIDDNLIKSSMVDAVLLHLIIIQILAIKSVFSIIHDVNYYQLSCEYVHRCMQKNGIRYR